MKTTFRKSMIWLHTYTGLLAGWLMFAVFFTGTLSYYNQEITHWMTGSNINKQSQHALLENGLNHLTEVAPNATQWRIQLPDDRGSFYRLSYREGKERNSVYLDPEHLSVIDEPQTRGGNFFRTFHYTLSMRQWGGRYLTGIVAMLMLIGVFTGIYTHRRFFKDFFTLRNKDKLKFNTDFHAISGVITIPFCFVICFSALLIYISMYQPFAINHYYDGFRALDREVSTRYEGVTPSGLANTKEIKLTDFKAELEQEWGFDAKLSSLVINHPNDSQGQIIFNKQKTDILSNKAESLAFDLQQHNLIEMPPERLARMTRRIFYGLHEAHFANPISRAMLFVCGMIATLLISTGMVIWLQKRQQKQTKRSYIVVDKLNNVGFYGLTLATASYFLVSKLPFSNSALVESELSFFFYTWLLSAVSTVWLKPQIGKKLLLLANAFAYSVLVIIDVTTIATNPQQFVNLPYLTLAFWVCISAIYFTRASYRDSAVGLANKERNYA